MSAQPVFDCQALYDALDAERRIRKLDWFPLAAQLWDQSADLNAQRSDHPLCGGAIMRLPVRKAISCQHVLYMLRWLDRSPEDFLTGRVVDVGDTRLPTAGPDRRLRWDLAQTHAELNHKRQHEGMTWAELALDIDCTPARLTNLRTARLADTDLALRVTQWLRRPAAAFVHPAQW